MRTDAVPHCLSLVPSAVSPMVDRGPLGPWSARVGQRGLVSAGSSVPGHRSGVIGPGSEERPDLAVDGKAVLPVKADDGLAGRISRRALTRGLVENRATDAVRGDDLAVAQLDGVVSRQVQLTNDRTTLGRRPYNDVVLDHLAVSGEHAVLLLDGAQVSIEDLDSTNGTFVNGRAVKRQAIGSDDVIEIGRYQLTLERDGTGASQLDEPAQRAGEPRARHEERREEEASASPATVIAPAGHDAVPASVKVLSGPAAGRELRLDKPVTTLGLPGVTIASISRHGGAFVLLHSEGPQAPTVNGTPLGTQPMTLHNGDLIGVAGSELRFEQR